MQVGGGEAKEVAIVHLEYYNESPLRMVPVMPGTSYRLVSFSLLSEQLKVKGKGT